MMAPSMTVTTYRANSLVFVRRVTRPCRAAASRWGRNSWAISSKHSARTEESVQAPFDIGKGSGDFCGTPLVIRYSQDMPRPRRAAESGLIYRALNRANARLAIFQTDEDYAAFQRVLAESAVPITFGCWLTALIPNHFHVLRWPP